MEGAFAYCHICGKPLVAKVRKAGEFSVSYDGACVDCEVNYPPSLLKAASDNFYYALRLRTGEIIHFHRATIHGEYVTLYRDDNDFSGTENFFEDVEKGLPFSCPRGVDVRIADIVWCADAPGGS